MTGARTKLVAGLVVLAALIPGTSTASYPSLPSPPFPACADPRGCPDLVTDPNTMNPRFVTQTFSEQSCDVQEGMVEAGTRNLVRFTFTTPNQGPGDLVVGPPRYRPDLFEYAECHGHYHFREYADYRLWTQAQFDIWHALRNAMPSMTAAQVLAKRPDLAPVEGAKRGFCVIDLRRYGSPSPPRYSSCNAQGISVGWADEYHYSLSGQYIDITGVARGSYVLESEVNAERVFTEADYTDNRAWVSITI